MKLPWDKKYITVSFHVIVTVLAVYLLYLSVNLISYLVLNLTDVIYHAGLILTRIFSVFSVVIIAFIIAYILDPMVTFYQDELNKLNKENFKTRAIGTSLAYLTIIFLLSLAVVIVIIKIGYGKGELSFIETMVESINRMRNDLGEFYASTAVQFNEWGIAEFFANIIEGIINKLMSFITDVPQDFAGILAVAGSSVVNFMLSLVIAFYFLKDKIKIKSAVNNTFKTLVPSGIAVKISDFLGEVNVIFEGYIRGQLIDAIIMGFLFSTALSVIGVPFAVLFGIFSGLSNIVPYFGAIVSFVLTVSVAFISKSPITALYAAISMLVLQQIDATFIIPKVIGQRVKLSPVLVLISITLGGRLFGVLGLIFAVPTCALIKISLTRYLNKKNAQ